VRRGLENCILLPSLRAILIAVFLIILPTQLHTQTPIAPQLTSNPTALVNPYRFPIEALLVHPSGVGYDRYQVVDAAAQSTVPASVPSGSLIASFAPISLTMAIANPPKCAVPGELFTRLNAPLAHEEVAIADQGGVDSAGTHQQEAIAEAQGALQLQQNLDELNVSIHDPVAAELRSEQYRDADPATRAQMDKEQQQQQIGELVDVVFLQAFSNSDFLFEHDDAAERERDQLSGVIHSQEQVLADLQLKYTQSQTRLKADLDFQRETAASLRQATVEAAQPISGPRQAARFCGGIANDQDIFALHYLDRANRSVLLGRAVFDHGGSEDLIFRRIRGTAFWTATAYWPLESRSANISVADGNSWAAAGSVDADRESIEQQLKGARKAISHLKSRQRAASYSADGGDEGRTTVIP
jgi:hypothetical protein